MHFRMNAKFQKIILSFKTLAVLSAISLAFYVLLRLTNTITAFRRDPAILEDLSSLAAEDPKVVSTIRTIFLTAPSKLPYNLSTDENYKLRSVSYSWPTINEVLVKLFDEEPPGFFIEAGALDGEFLSNSLWLEKNLGWNGLLIEPEPHNFLELVSKHRKSWSSNSCLSSSSHPQQVVMEAPRVKDEYQQLVDPMAIRGQTHLVEEIDNDEIYKNNDAHIRRQHFKCQCFPLYSYLSVLNITTIDFLSLDLQGPEVSIFTNIPLDKVHIRTVVIEHETNGAVFDYKFVKQMNKLGFLLVVAAGAPDYFFINKIDEYLVGKIEEWPYQNAVDTSQTLIAKFSKEN